MSEVRIARLEEQVKAGNEQLTDTKSLIVAHIDNCEKIREAFRRDMIGIRRDMTGVKISQAKSGVIISAVVIAMNIILGVVVTRAVDAMIGRVEAATEKIEASK